MLEQFLFTKEYRIEGRQVGPENRLKPSALLWLFMETSEAHMNSLGWNHTRLVDEDMAFLIIHNKVSLKHIPRFGEEYKIETAPIGNMGAQFYRGFRLVGKDGVVGEMTQTSVLVNPHTHQLQRPKNFYKLDIFPDVKVSSKWIVTAPETPEVLYPLGVRTIYYSDLDYNNHLNNTIYADICMDFCADRLGGHAFSGMHIQYIAEALLHDEVVIEGTSLLGGGFYCQGSHTRGLCFKAILQKDDSH